MLRKNTEKYITFTVPIEKKITRIYKNGEKITKNIFYKFHFIHSALSNFVNNFSKGIYKIKCKQGHDECRLAELNINIATVLLNTQTLKMI